MTKDPRGTKRHCHSCQETFYDLDRDPIVCPLCQTAFDPEVLLKSRKVKPVVEAVEEKTPPPAGGEGAAAAGDGIAEVGEEVGEEVQEDALGDDGEVIKVRTDDDDTDEESLVAGGEETITEDIGAVDSEEPDEADPEDGDAEEEGEEEGARDG